MAANGRGIPSGASATAPGSTVPGSTYTDTPEPAGPPKKRKHRAGKKRRNRRQSFAAADVMDTGDMTDDARPSLNSGAVGQASHNSSFYRLRQKRSNDSLESEALLDHRDQPPTLQTRRQSVQVGSLLPPAHKSQSYAGSPKHRTPRTEYPFSRSNLSQQQRADDSDEDDADDHTPLMSQSMGNIRSGNSYGGTSNLSTARARRASRSSASSGMRQPPFGLQHHSQTNLDNYDVNNPPSVPGSPIVGPTTPYGDVMLPPDLESSHASPSRSRDALIDIDEEPTPRADFESAPTSPPGQGEFRRRMTMMHGAEDVCFPQDAMSEIGQEDYTRPDDGDARARRRRRRWPDFRILNAWAAEEKEERTMEGLRARKISEPLMVEGRLRPQKRVWHRDVEDAPYRFTYFNEEFENTIHSQTISELVQPGQTFRNLFVPDPPILEDESDSDTDEEDTVPMSRTTTLERPSMNGLRGPPQQNTQQTSSGEQTRSSTPGRSTPKPNMEKSTAEGEKPIRYGPRPAFWLDVLSPTEAEMKTLSKAFGIHPLTAEDILMQEQREKVELFKHYYFINYRTFEQDENSEDYMEPVNLYVVVFREGVISFHFSMTPHPANVRRRIRQLKDYLILSPDWISYAIIDDITDVYAPLIQKIEDEVDDIDEVVLRSYSLDEEQEAKKQSSPSYNNPHYEKDLVEGTKTGQDGGRDMLRRVGECRKKVMGLYRLLGTKADVIKGFAKRCNEQWDVAPRSDIGLYLGDIQDHIVTMTANLGHYETLLARAHSNYLAQVNIRMNERQEKTSDILGKLTVLGTIVLPMNVVTGIWGMNCLVPGQDIENLNWFWCITSGLLMFGLLCYLIAKRVYGIV